MKLATIVLDNKETASLRYRFWLHPNIDHQSEVQ